MKFVSFAFVLLISSARSPGQSAFGGFAFGDGVPSGSHAHFGLEAPGFPDSSARTLELEAVAPRVSPAPSVRYAYPVRQFRFGRDAMTNFAASGRAGGRPLMLVFRNQTVDTSWTCWIEGTMLHYINSFNSHATIPVKRVNWKLTEETNSMKPGTLISLLGK